MSHADANFRNTAPDSVVTLAKDAGRTIVTVPPWVRPTGGFITLTCGETITSDIGAAGFKSVYRFWGNALRSLRYYGRLGHLQFDTPGPLEITVTATDFTPYLTVMRDAEHYWQSADGVVSEDIDASLTGEFVIEVTSVEPYGHGSFDIHVTCEAPVEFAYTLTAAGSDGYAPYTLVLESDAAGDEFEWSVRTELGEIYSAFVANPDPYIVQGSATQDLTLTIKLWVDGALKGEEEVVVPHLALPDTLHAELNGIGSVDLVWTGLSWEGTYFLYGSWIPITLTKTSGLMSYPLTLTAGWATYTKVGDYNSPLDVWGSPVGGEPGYFPDIITISI